LKERIKDVLLALALVAIFAMWVIWWRNGLMFYDPTSGMVF